MLVFGTQMHIVTFIFVLVEASILLFQLCFYLFRAQNRNRLLYLILLMFLLIYNIVGGLFPDPKINISMSTQMIFAYGSGFLMASYFPFYFYKACDLTSLRWHAYFGVPLFLVLPYLFFLVVIYAINGHLDHEIKYGMIAPFLYAIVLLFALLRAIRRKHREERGHHKYLEELIMYFAVTPWASLTFFCLVERSQLIEALCTNTGIIGIALVFLGQSIKGARQEYERLLELDRHDSKSSIFEEMCHYYRLTKREKEIVLLIRQGLTYKEISRKLFISGKTVENHVQHIYEKANVKNKIALIHRFFDAS